MIDAICEELEVSPKAVSELLKDYQTLFHVQPLGDDVFSISHGGDPAQIYDCRMRCVLCLQLMEEVLKPRELNLVRCYLGIDQAIGKGMTFQELATQSNYNGPNGVERAHRAALRKLRKELWCSKYGW